MTGSTARIETEEEHDYDIGELYTMSLDGTEVKRLTYNADTSWLADLALLFPTGNAIETINADGSCRKLVRSSEKVALHGAAWAARDERSVGRIAC